MGLLQLRNLGWVPNTREGVGPVKLDLPNAIRKGALNSRLAAAVRKIIAAAGDAQWASSSISS
jgi:hypothetical protein